MRRNEKKKKICALFAAVMISLGVLGTVGLSHPTFAAEPGGAEMEQSLEETQTTETAQGIDPVDLQTAEDNSSSATMDGIWPGTSSEMEEESGSVTDENSGKDDSGSANQEEEKLSQVQPERFMAALPAESMALMASTPEAGYSVWDTIYDRQVTDASGNVDAEWSFCMNSDRSTPGSSGGGTSGYEKIDFADESVYLANRSGSNPDFQRVKRLLYYRMTHPDTNWSVMQNEYWYEETGRSFYNTSWGIAAYDAQKLAIRAAANDSSLDELIDERMVVTVYRYNGSKYQNTITARMETIDIPVTKVWNNEAGLSLPDTVTVHLSESTGSLHIPDADLALSAENGWTGSFTNLPRYTGLQSGNPQTAVYSLSEDAVAGFTTMITGDPANGYTVTNTSQGNTPELGSLKVSKHVTGNMGEKQRQFAIHVILYAADLDENDLQQAITYEYQGDVNEITPVQLLEAGSEGVDVKLMLKDGESITFAHLPYGMNYQVLEEDYQTEGYDAPVYIIDEQTEQDELQDVIGSETVWIEVKNNRTAVIDTGIDLGWGAALYRLFMDLL